MSARAKRSQPTGEWLQQTAEYRTWRASSSSDVLWLHGKAGCGKTILSSVVIDELQGRFGSAHDTAVLYFFIDANDVAKRTSLGLVKSAILQLMQKDTHFIDPLEKYRYSIGADHFFDNLESSRPTTSGLIEVLHSACSALNRVFFVIDALDERLPDDDLLTIIGEISKFDCTAVQLFSPAGL